MDAAASSRHLPRVLEINSYNQEVSSKLGRFIIFFKNRLSQTRFLKVVAIMLIEFIKARSTRKSR